MSGEKRAAGRQEMPAVRTTIVGGRPPGCGKGIGEIPRGIEVLVKKAAVDAEFKDLLLEQRAGAAGEIGLELDPAEIVMLNAVTRSQLEAIIARTRVRPTLRKAFLGRAAAVMLAALGAAAVSGCGEQADPAGSQVDRPEVEQQPVEPKQQPTTTPTFVAGLMVEPTDEIDEEPPAEEPKPPDDRVTRGIRPDRPDMTLGSRPDRP